MESYNEENQVTLEDVLPEAKVITEAEVYGNDCPHGHCDV